MRYMGLDLGSKTLGVAFSDPSGIIASAYGTHVFSDGDYIEAAKHAAKLIDEHKVGKVILGHPKNMDGSTGFQARISENFKSTLENLTSVPVVLWDERLTTRIANQTMYQAKTKQKDKKHKVDQLAAAVLLQSYLDSGK